MENTPIFNLYYIEYTVQLPEELKYGVAIISTHSTDKATKILESEGTYRFKGLYKVLLILQIQGMAYNNIEALIVESKIT